MIVFRTRGSPKRVGCRDQAAKIIVGVRGAVAKRVNAGDSLTLLIINSFRNSAVRVGGPYKAVQFIVFISCHAPQGIGAGGNIAVGIVGSRGRIAQRIHYAVHAPHFIVMEGGRRTGGVRHCGSIGGNIERGCAGRNPQRVGRADQASGLVVGVGGFMAQWVGGGDQTARRVVFIGCRVPGGVNRLDQASRVVVHVLYGSAKGIRHGNLLAACVVLIFGDNVIYVLIVLGSGRIVILHRAYDLSRRVVFGVRDASARIGGIGQVTERIISIGPGLAAGVSRRSALPEGIVGVAGRAPGRVGGRGQVAFEGVGVAGHATQRICAAG